MNDENLKKGNATQFTSGEEAARNGKKGGIASAKKKQQKADIKATVQDVLNDEYTDKSGKTLSGIGVLVVNLFRIAADPKNKQCITAMKMIFDIYNDKDKNKLLDQKTKAEIKLLEAKVDMLTGSDTEALDKLDAILKGIKDNADNQTESETE